MTERPAITTHILDLVHGKPAVGIAVRLFSAGNPVASGVTNEDGRVAEWDTDFTVSAGRYRLEFDVEPWFNARGERSFYEDVHISFHIDDADEHYHVPLLLSPFGYSTYRGS